MILVFVSRQHRRKGENLMANIFNRLFGRWTWKTTVASAHRQRPRVEALEDRWAPAVGLALVPRPVVEVNPQPLPPGDVVQFDAQPIFSNLLPPGPSQFTDMSFQLNGQFSDNGQQVSSGPTGVSPNPLPWSLAGVYSLKVHIHETLVPPGPTVIPGFFDVTYTVEGSVDSVLTVDQTEAGAAPQEIVTISRERLVSHGEILGTISPADSAGGQQIAFIVHSVATYENNDRSHVSITGQRQHEPVTLVRGITHDESFSNWVESLQSSPGSDVVAAIDANFSVTDHLNEALLIRAPLHPPNPCIFDTVLSGTGSRLEIVVRKAGGEQGSFDLNGSAQDQANLNEIITLLSTPSFQVDNVFAAAGSLNESAVVLPPQPVNLATPVPLAPSGIIFTATPTFTWTAVAGATQYFLWIEDVNTGGVIVVPGETNTSFTFPLTAGDTYVWSVQAQDNIGDASAVSPIMEFTIVQPKVINPTPVPGA
jgi:hypothetical protein